MGLLKNMLIYGIARFMLLMDPNYYRIWDYGYVLPSDYEDAHLATYAAAEMWAQSSKFRTDPTGLLHGMQQALNVLYEVMSNNLVELFASNLMAFIFPSGRAIKFVDIVDGNKVLYNFRVNEDFLLEIPPIPVEYVIVAGQFKPSAYLAIREKTTSDIIVPHSEDWPYWDDTNHVIKFGTEFSPNRTYGEVEIINDLDGLEGFFIIYKILKATGLVTILSNFVSTYFRNQKLKQLEERVIEEIDENEKYIVQVYDEVKGIYKGAYH